MRLKSHHPTTYKYQSPLILPPISSIKNNKEFYSKIKTKRNASQKYIEQSMEQCIVKNQSSKKHLKTKIKQEIAKKKRIVTEESLYGYHKDYKENQNNQETLTNFEVEVSKNLAFIKKEKQNRKKNSSIKSIKQIRYASPETNRQYASPETNRQSKKPKETLLLKKYDDLQLKCLTQEDVFTKINEVINKKVQTKSPGSQGDIAQFLSEYSSVGHATERIKQEKQYLNNERHQLSNYKQAISKIMKTEGNASLQTRQNKMNKFFESVKQRTIKIKHQQNYHEWRKISLDPNQNSKRQYRYEESSYDKETERLEKYLSKNQESLKKYFQSKDYLRRLQHLSPPNQLKR